MRDLRHRWLLLCDMLFVVSMYVLGTSLTYPINELPRLLANNFIYLLVTGLIYIVSLYVGGSYQILWTMADTSAVVRLLRNTLFAGIISLLVGNVVPWLKVGLRFAILLNIEIPLCISSLRLLIIVVSRQIRARNGEKQNGKRTLIIGAGELGVLLVREILQNKSMNNFIVGFVDDDPKKNGRIVYGKKVLGTCDNVPEICKEYQIEEIIFAIYSIDKARKKEIIDICSESGLRVKILEGVDAVLDKSVNARDIRDVDIEDLLERDPIVLENQLISQQIKDKVVLVTGGGGSIGSELCRQIMTFEPKTLVILDIYENTTYVLQQELEEKYPGRDIRVLIASVRDLERMERIFDKFRPNLVFHAAAHKHVPLMEFSPCEAVKNNVFGTYHVAYCADKYGAQGMTLISTDKAVNPTNAMGASKRLCEMIVEAFSTVSKTRYTAVRFGNVLGSNGSVVPRFRKQIAAGGPVTVTHREITRFFMTGAEATQLVLQAMAYATGGEIFVLDMGEPVKIYDLAEKMIRLSGHIPNVDIPIEVTGLRPGEKLYEELLMDEEGLISTRHKQIFIGKLIDISMPELMAILEDMREVCQAEEEDVKMALARAVPTYQMHLTKEYETANA